MVALILMIYSCSTHPEKSILAKYFNAMSLNDTNTLSTMAIEPADFDFNSWEIVNVSEESVDPFNLNELDSKEKELKKKLMTPPYILLMLEMKWILLSLRWKDDEQGLI